MRTLLQHAAAFAAQLGLAAAALAHAPLGPLVGTALLVALVASMVAFLRHPPRPLAAVPVPVEGHRARGSALSSETFRVLGAAVALVAAALLLASGLLWRERARLHAQENRTALVTERAG